MRRCVGCLKELLMAACLVGFVSTVAQACPMCSQSIAEENALPRAYMYSILFMLAMPATVFSGFGFFIYRKLRQHEEAQLAAIHEGAVSASPVAPQHG